MFERFTEKSIKVVMLAQEEARRLGHNFVGTEQILLGLIGEGSGNAWKVLKNMGVTLKIARVEVEKIIGRGGGFVSLEVPFTPRAKRVLEMSLEEARQLGSNYIATEHLLLGLTREVQGVALMVLDNLSVFPFSLREQVLRQVGEKQFTNVNTSGWTTSELMSRTPNIDDFGFDMTAASKFLDPVVGRDKEILRVIQILGRRTKNNPCLVGEPGVGKTAVTEGLAQKISIGDVPDSIRDRRVISLDLALLVAGTKYRGEFEERVKRLMDEVRRNKEIILMIDEVHTLIGAGAAEGAIDAANILKPALARGHMQIIGATTRDEYRKHIEKDAALERRFQPVLVPEPTVNEAIEILRGLRELYEAHHKVSYTDEAIRSAVEYSHQYISDRFLPDKAIDLIDEAGSRVRHKQGQLPEAVRGLDRKLRALISAKESAVRCQDFRKARKIRRQEEEILALLGSVNNVKDDAAKSRGDVYYSSSGVVRSTDIAAIVSLWTGIPLEKVSEEETTLLVKLEETLHARVIGQEEAVVAISRALRRARVGMKHPCRPIASFIFAGPTGVGKSELAKTLARIYFGSEDAMVRLDMSEFMERHTVSKLIGSPPGYVGFNEGGQLTESVRRRPYTLILFDEIEKAHPDVFNVMLQILEDGRLSDSSGRVVDFKHCLLVLTSNVGSRVIEQRQGGIGFQMGHTVEDCNSIRNKSLVDEELKKYFRPEFLNRLDDIIVFRQLSKLEVKQIADIFLYDVIRRAAEKGLTVEVTERFKDKIVEDGYNPIYGARPLRRAISRLVEDSIAETILTGELKDSDSVILDVNSEGSVLVLYEK